MVAYSFQKQFATPILDGTKGGTIRADRKRHARPGEELQLYTGMRTKHCRLISRETCAGVTPIRLYLKGDRVIIGEAGARTPRVDIRSARALDIFARFDGFVEWDALCSFWRETHEALQDFSGQHIRWLDLPLELLR